MELIDDSVLPEEKVPNDNPSGWDDEGNDEDSDEYYEDSVKYECYK